MVLTFVFVDETLKCDHSNEGYWAVLSCGVVYYVQALISVRSYICTQLYLYAVISVRSYICTQLYLYAVISVRKLYLYAVISVRSYICTQLYLYAS